MCVVCVFWSETRLMTVKHTHSLTHSLTHTLTHTLTRSPWKHCALPDVSDTHTFWPSKPIICVLRDDCTVTPSYWPVARSNLQKKT